MFYIPDVNEAQAEIKAKMSRRISLWMKARLSFAIRKSLRKKESCCLIRGRLDQSAWDYLENVKHYKVQYTRDENTLILWNQK